ncbi:MAG: Gfo/Idh/MocA family oxidoreductase [Chloroflexi bacterium]|nr:Gfo/Idh/MocA family oxidoreductase [Chloroflexota bacterium]MBV9133562.1 Gfo/Idh/MocA family oxidoreductase [Chloroflexota bacterium]MBV9895933.1 Gfo/Idh/MocA family oxidoreductase [Chloroflexota bacterium]
MTTRLGVAGLGWLGEALIRDAVASPAFSVVAVQDVVPDRGREVADRYAVPWHGDRYEDLLGVPDVQAVLICTPNHLHAAQAQLALQAGKHALVQKPLALSAADARQTVAAAHGAGRLLFVDYTYRFLESMAVLRDLLPSVGPVRSMRAAFHNIYGPGAEKTWFFSRSTAGGGALTDLGVHLLDLGLWLLRPGRVGLLTAKLSAEEPVEHAAELRLALDEVPFEVAVSWNASLSSTQICLEVETQAAMVRWENLDGSFFRFRTVRDGELLLDRETTLRDDTLRAFAAALADPSLVPVIDTRVYDMLDQAYGRP